MGKVLPLILILLTLVSVGYVHIFSDALQVRATFNTPTDLVIGVLLIALVLIGTYLSFGSALVVVAGLAIAYVFGGHYLPGYFHSMKIELVRAIANLSIGLTGIYELLGLSANFVFLFVVLAAVLQIGGGIDFFMQVGKLAAGRFRAGPAMSAVVTSGLVGMITGSVGANIATVGSFTIPLMKKVGYKAEQAGGIEAAASTGGQVMPPVMGDAAFAMASITGISYLHIAVSAVIPALLYFLSLGLYAQFRAQQLNLIPLRERVDIRELLLRAPLLLVPLGVIVYLLIPGHSLAYCAFWGVVSALFLSFLRKQTRPSLGRLAEGFTKGAIAGSQIAFACACIGIVVRALIMTGMGVRLPAVVAAWSGGSLILAVVIVMVVSILLGMAMATLAVYLTVAIVCAPILMNMGLDVMQAHFFVFFFAIFSAVTPPVAPASIIATKVAGAKYLPTALEACKASIAGFVLPFLIIWNPVLLLQPDSTPVPLIIAKLVACLVLILVLQVAIGNHYIGPLRIWERISFTACAGVIVVYFISPHIALLIVGLGIFVLASFLQLYSARLRRRQGQAEVSYGTTQG
jgi:TRAP transporter 4TM/12TM fusion protein